MRKIKALITGLLSAIILIVCLVIPLHGSGAVSSEGNDLFIQKISGELKEIISNSSENDLIPVYIFRKQISDNEINTMLLSETGINAKLYYGQDGVYSIAAPIMSSTESDVSSISNSALTMEEQSVVSPEIDNYIASRNSIIKREYVKMNAEFKDTYIPNDREIKYIGSYTSTIIVEATPKEILQYARLDDVEDIAYYENCIPTPALDIVMNQVQADRTTGTKSTKYNSGSGYTGKDIIIGVIEANGGRYDPNAPQLKSINGTRLQYIPNVKLDGTTVSNSVSEHASIVTSVIVGQAYTINGITYEGVVPDATVYQTSVVDSEDLYTAFNVLANYGVNIINYSASSRASAYSSMDKEIDRLVASTGITFVCSAGNTSNEDTSYAMTSPARALNVIAVGNVDTKSHQNVARPSPYPMSTSSKYVDSSFLPNKPDVSAPGSRVSIVYPTTAKISSGTSISTPIVTGIAAQAMQSYPTLKGYPYAVKSVICFECKSIACFAERWKY